MLTALEELGWRRQSVDSFYFSSFLSCGTGSYEAYYSTSRNIFKICYCSHSECFAWFGYEYEFAGEELISAALVSQIRWPSLRGLLRLLQRLGGKVGFFS